MSGTRRRKGGSRSSHRPAVKPPGKPPRRPLEPRSAGSDPRGMQDPRARDTWTVFKIMGEFVEGFETLRPVWPAVSIFGSARVRPGHPFYKDAERVASALSEAGFSVITGGGPGVMEAANKGARKGDGRSIGLSIKLPREQATNRFVDLNLHFDYFFARKVMFVKYACGFVALPGGFGTLDEIFEALTLIQTGKIHDFPVVLFNRSYWGGLVRWIRGRMLKEQLIEPRELALFHVTDDPEELVHVIEHHYLERMRERGERGRGRETP